MTIQVGLRELYVNVKRGRLLGECDIFASRQVVKLSSVFNWPRYFTGIIIPLFFFFKQISY